MKHRSILLALVAALATTAVAGASGESLPHYNPAQSAPETRAMVDATLARLYELEPSAEQAINQAVAYAVFQIDASGNGRGMVVEDSIQEFTLMGVHGSGPVPGGGYRQVWVIRDPKTYREFKAYGWSFPDGARLQLRMVRGQQWPVGALEVNDRILVYHLGNDGLASEVSLPRSRYLRNWAFDRRRVQE